MCARGASLLQLFPDCPALADRLLRPTALLALESASAAADDTVLSLVPVVPIAANNSNSVGKHSRNPSSGSITIASSSSSSSSSHDSATQQRGGGGKVGLSATSSANSSAHATDDDEAAAVIIGASAQVTSASVSRLLARHSFNSATATAPVPLPPSLPLPVPAAAAAPAAGLSSSSTAAAVAAVTAAVAGGRLTPLALAAWLERRRVASLFDAAAALVPTARPLTVADCPWAASANCISNDSSSDSSSGLGRGAAVAAAGAGVARGALARAAAVIAGEQSTAAAALARTRYQKQAQFAQSSAQQQQAQTMLVLEPPQVVFVRPVRREYTFYGLHPSADDARAQCLAHISNNNGGDYATDDDDDNGVMSSESEAREVEMRVFMAVERNGALRVVNAEPY